MRAFVRTVPAGCRIEDYAKLWEFLSLHLSVTEAAYENPPLLKHFPEPLKGKAHIDRR